MCNSTKVTCGGVFLTFSPAHRQSKQWPKVVEDDKLFVALVFTLPGKRRWLPSLLLRRAVVWWDSLWWKVLPQDVQLPSCLMSSVSSWSSNLSFLELPLALCSSAFSKTEFEWPLQRGDADLVCDRSLCVLMFSQKPPHHGKKQTNKNPQSHAQNCMFTKSTKFTLVIE